MSARMFSTSPNRTWPTVEPKGWQSSKEFFELYPTPSARRAFYESRRKMNNQIRAGVRKPDGTLRNLPAPLHGPRPLGSVAGQVVELTTTTL